MAERRDEHASPTTRDRARQPRVRSLADLSPGERAVISGYRGKGPQVQRMMQLGLLTGEPVTMVRASLGGDPIEYRVMDYALSLRRQEAALVDITVS